MPDLTPSARGERARYRTIRGGYLHKRALAFQNVDIVTGVEDLRIGVIGLGMRASLARYAHRPGQGSVVTALCDSDPAVLKSQAGQFDAEFLTEDYRRLLDRDDLDAVIVVTPDDTHERVAI